jgi:hypothetical protein
MPTMLESDNNRLSETRIGDTELRIVMIALTIIPQNHQILSRKALLKLGAVFYMGCRFPAELLIRPLEPGVPRLCRSNCTKSREGTKFIYTAKHISFHPFFRFNIFYVSKWHSNHELTFIHTLFRNSIVRPWQRMDMIHQMACQPFRFVPIRLYIS